MGADNQFSIEQSGDFNEVVATGAGILFDQQFMAQQQGDFNLIDVLLAGSDNVMNITQIGAGNWVTGDTGPSFVQGGNAGLVSISQLGNDNLVMGSQMGSGNMMTVTQVGDFNTATVIQH